MKSPLVLVGLVVMLANAAYAQSWETVFTLPPTDPPSEPNPAAIMQDPFGPPESGNSRLIVGMQSRDHDLYRINLTDGTSQGQFLSDPNRGARSLAYDPVSGSLFAVSDSRWKVFRSSDQGASWTLVDSFADAAVLVSPTGLAVDNAGNIYVSGTTNSNTTFAWIVRKSSDHGITWSTVDRLSNQSATGGILFVPGSQGGLFVAGSRWTGNANIWTVRRSRDAGATWQQVDSFALSGKDTVPWAIANDARGRIYVAGYSSPDPWQWEVRMSESGGSTWTTISPPNATAQMHAGLKAMVVDLAGNLFVAGALDAWAVARRTPDGVWQDIEFPFGAEFGWVPSLAEAMTVDTVGNVLVAGRVRSGWPGTITSSLVIQKLAATMLPPVRIARAGDSLVLSWPATTTGFQLESTATLGAGAVWTEVSTPPVVIGNEQIVTVDIGPGSQFFRLRKL